MKSFLNNFAAFAAIITFVLFVEFVKAVRTSQSERHYHTQYKVPENSASSNDPTYPLPAMRILQIW